MLFAALLALAGGLLVLAGLTMLGAGVIGVGAALLILIPWIGLLAPSYQGRPGEPGLETSTRNSYLGFVIGLLQRPPPKDSGSARND